MNGAAGNLTWTPAAASPHLLAPATAAVIGTVPSAQVTAIDASLADTAAFCEAYDVDPANSANCVIVSGKRGGETTMAAVMILATGRADINGAVRRYLDVRKISFAAMDVATSLSGMEYGGITPVGLPTEWPILIDAGVLAAGEVVIGSGIRGSKLKVTATDLLTLPHATQLELSLPTV